jgi:hypothetical protein
MVIQGHPQLQKKEKGKRNGQGVVAICNPSYTGGRGRMIAAPRQPKQKHEALSEKQTKAEGTRSGTEVVERLSSVSRTTNNNKRAVIFSDPVSPRGSSDDFIRSY